MTKMMEDYQLVSSDLYATFVDKIRKLGNRGYVPTGGVCVNGQGFGVTYYQAMVKYEEEE